MNFKGIEVCCPRCKSDLEYNMQAEYELSCNSCGSVYPIIAGIPDLRIFSDPYIDIEADRAKGSKIADHLDAMSFTQLVDYYYSITDVVTAKQARQFTRGLISAESRSNAVLQIWMNTSDVNLKQRGGKFLEVGCGTGPLLVNASQHFDMVVGIDIAFRWLVVAKKRLQEAGKELPLICACAEALPFPDRAFDVLAAEAALENLKDQHQSLKECNRVLDRDGNLWISTSNQYCIGPDPQTGIWAAGYLPEKILADMVVRQGGIPPKRKMVSARSLKSLLRTTGFQDPILMLTEVQKDQRDNYGKGLQLLIDVYTLASRLPISRDILLWIGPTILATTAKFPA